MLTKFIAILMFVHLVCGINPSNLCLPLSQMVDQHQQVQSPSEVVQGRAGKMGPAGQVGPKGDKGDIGPPGHCNCDDSPRIQALVEQLKIFNETVQQLVKVTQRSPNDIRCRVPDAPQFGSVFPNVAVVSVGATINYRCKNGSYGFVGEGQQQLIAACKEDLTWTRERPICQKCEAGLKDGSIKDNQMSASSQYSNNYLPQYGRLDKNLGLGTWHPSSPYVGAWLQVDFLIPTGVVGIITQGYPRGGTYWLSGFKISYGNSTDQMQVIQASAGGDKTFEANPADKSGKTHVTNRFPAPVTGRYFRLIVGSYISGPHLRMEYLLC